MVMVNFPSTRFFNRPFFKDNTFEHDSQTAGYQSLIALSPVREKTIVVVSNAPSLNGFNGIAGS